MRLWIYVDKTTRTFHSAEIEDTPSMTYSFSSIREVGEFLQKGRVVGTPFGQLSLRELEQLEIRYGEV